jgi:hypothetical protein
MSALRTGGSGPEKFACKLPRGHIRARRWVEFGAVSRHTSMPQDTEDILLILPIDTAGYTQPSHVCCTDMSNDGDDYVDQTSLA